MKKSMITLCIAALAAFCTPALAGEDHTTPPVKQEVRIINESDLVQNDVIDPATNNPESLDVTGQETGTSDHYYGGGYVVISGAGLLLLIILLIILL